MWGETYAREDVLARLRDELAGEASLRICHDRSGTVLGFCWAQLLDAAAVMRAVDTIKFYQSMALPDLPDRIDALLAGTRVLYVHDLGIARSARSRVPLTQLIYPVLADVARRTGHGRVLFWTMPETRVSTLARRARFVECPMPNGMRFHLGEFRAHHDGNGLWAALDGDGGHGGGRPRRPRQAVRAIANAGRRDAVRYNRRGLGPVDRERLGPRPMSFACVPARARGSLRERGPQDASRGATTSARAASGGPSMHGPAVRSGAASEMASGCRLGLTRDRSADVTQGPTAPA